MIIIIYNHNDDTNNNNNNDNKPSHIHVTEIKKGAALICYWISVSFSKFLYITRPDIGDMFTVNL